MEPAHAKTTVITQLEAIGFVWDVLLSVSIPTALLALLGRWLDVRWQTGPYLTIVGLVLALAISGALVYRKAKDMAKRMKTSPV